jgi:hypothetical protein
MSATAIVEAEIFRTEAVAAMSIDFIGLSQVLSQGACRTWHAQLDG